MIDQKYNRHPQADALIGIMGAGFAGICMGIQLKRAGIHDFVIVEKADDVGGTWRDNTYPGAACDVPSHLYCYSFEPNPDWSRSYAPQEEIQDYIRHCVDKHELLPHIRFNTEIVSARYNEKMALWEVRDAKGMMARVHMVISAKGALQIPALPAIPGLENFKGDAFHSAQWRHDVDLTGKEVAVIGTGASAIQIVPAIAGTVKKLSLFQRTPPWVLPKFDRGYLGIEKFMFKRFPRFNRLHRNSLYWMFESRALGFVVDPRLMKLGEAVALNFIRRSISDPALQSKVTPKYTMGCKRVLMSNEYYPALNRPNVEVVSEGIQEIREHSIVTADGVEHPVDTIIYSTGFHVTDSLLGLSITGKDGLDLAEAWQKGMEAYYGITINKFPNMFMLLGPNTGLGHNSIIFMIEAQVNYVMQAITRMLKKGYQQVEVRRAIQKAFVEDMQRRSKNTVWKAGCSSWYLDENGKNTTLWPGFTVQYWMETRKFDERDYRIVKTEA